MKPAQGTRGIAGPALTAAERILKAGKVKKVKLALKVKVKAEKK